MDRYDRYLKRQKLNKSVRPVEPDTPDKSIQETETSENPVTANIQEVDLSRLVDQATQTNNEVDVVDGESKKNTGSSTLYQRIKANEKLLNFHTGLPNHEKGLQVQ